uniref:Uncharacterized protein n=1 Tax=Parascaris equorum TaxID=6256 RepID=A0A914RUC0_PAREQ
MTKRRVCENNEKRRKRRKEPRPHPSYRLNKRYWDDIRAGRRVHDGPSFQPQQRSAPVNRGNTVNSFAGTLMPKTEPEDIIDVTSFDDENIKAFVNPIEKQECEIQTAQVRPRESDFVVDEIADEMFKELIGSKRSKGREKLFLAVMNLALKEVRCIVRFMSCLEWDAAAPFTPHILKFPHLPYLY